MEILDIDAFLNFLSADFNVNLMSLCVISGDPVLPPRGRNAPVWALRFHRVSQIMIRDGRGR